MAKIQIFFEKRTIWFKNDAKYSVFLLGMGTTNRSTPVGETIGVELFGGCGGQRAS